MIFLAEEIVKHGFGWPDAVAVLGVCGLMAFFAWCMANDHDCDCEGKQ